MSLAKHSPAETIQKLYKKPKNFPVKRPDTGHFLAVRNSEDAFPNFPGFYIF
jgi:hypothetical protein